MIDDVRREVETLKAEVAALREATSQIARAALMTTPPDAEIMRLDAELRATKALAGQLSLAVMNLVVSVNQLFSRMTNGPHQGDPREGTREAWSLAQGVADDVLGPMDDQP